MISIVLFIAPSVDAKTLDGIPNTALKLAINAYRWSLKHHVVKNPYMLTIVDFDKPSYQKRLWVIDLRNDHIIMDMHVAQGRNSGKIYATHFSNQPGSHESSLGIFTTLGNTFKSEFGKSLHLRGWEQGINSNAFYRGILVHSAWYVTPYFVDRMGYAGMTWGCFAVNPDRIERLIQLIHGGSVFFAYATPEKNDPRVNHRLSYTGKKLYKKIVGINSNPLVRFFEVL